MKKAQGISINVIIIAAIALIVLVIIIAIFTGRMGSWGKSLSRITGDVTKPCDREQNVPEGYTVGLKSSDECAQLEGAIITSSQTTGTMVCCVY